MRSSGPISLFSGPAPPSRQPLSIAVSVVAHCLALGLVWAGILSRPAIRQPVAERFTLRNVELHQPDSAAHRMQQAASNYPRSGSATATSHAANRTARKSSMRLTAQLKAGRQTLIQPKVPKQDEVAQDVPVPAMVIWSPEKTRVKQIVPPKPDKPTAADVKPSTAQPNAETHLADVAVSSTAFSSSQPIAASATSPVAMQAPELDQMPPTTTSDTAGQPTPAAILSLSDLLLKDGTVTLPPVNESAALASEGALAAGQPDETSGSAANGPDPGADSGAMLAANAGGAQLNQSGTQSGAPMGAEAGDGPGTAAQITLPRDGVFGVVVVGAALEEKYPETAELWSGRMAYTVYLHVGLAKSWILQYSLPRDAEAAAAGNATRLEAPWPYDIVRPNIAPGAINADALMIRGMVNASGRFESLAIVFPQPFAQAEFVLKSLAQWQFRPAAQGGQATPVEVLLIIPDVE